jgi:hypothetical protein
MDVAPFSKEIREVRSCVSDENWEAEACELRERLLADGDKMLGFCCGDSVDAAAARAFGVPRTRPPPSVLRDMIRCRLWEHGR